MRVVVLVFTAIVTLFALHTEASIYKMVENAYKVTLVAAFVPLVLGLYWRRATAQGALLAITGGVSSWIGCEIFAPEGLFPPQLVGVLCSLGGLLAGSLLPQWHRHAEVPAAQPGH